MRKGGFIYFMTNYKNTTIYCGVTNNLSKRVYEHKNRLVKSFTSRYNLNNLVYFEHFDSIENAIMREKQIKGGSRKRKIDLIESNNPDWRDLSDDIE